MGAPLLQEDAGDRDLPCRGGTSAELGDCVLPACIVYQHPYFSTNLVGTRESCLGKNLPAHASAGSTAFQSFHAWSGLGSIQQMLQAANYRKESYAELEQPKYDRSCENVLTTLKTHDQFAFRRRTITCINGATRTRSPRSFTKIKWILVVMGTVAKSRCFGVLSTRLSKPSNRIGVFDPRLENPTDVHARSD